MSSLREILDELEATLEEERGALRTLQGAKIEAATQRKTALEERLRAIAASEQPLGITERHALERIRDATRRNMVLVVHARACVRGALAAARGSLMGAYPSSRSSSASDTPLRVDIRR